MIKNPFRKLLILSAAVAVLTVGLTGCSQGDEGIDPEYVARLEQECVDLRNQVQQMQKQLGDLEQSVVLKSYALKAVPNKDNTGASIEITASPMRWQEGQKARFRVYLNGAEMSSAEGSWNGSAYTAAVDLAAADGYTYECALTQPDGTESQIILSSPEAPLYESCVYLASGLNVYCNLFIEDWDQQDGNLILTTGYAQVQLPRISSHAVDYKSSSLVLKLGQKELQRREVTLPRGEAEGCYESVLSNIEFKMPELGDAEQLDLWLEVVLTDGKVLTYNGCSWFIYEGNLSLAVG